MRLWDNQHQVINNTLGSLEEIMSFLLRTRTMVHRRKPDALNEFVPKWMHKTFISISICSVFLWNNPNQNCMPSFIFLTNKKKKKSMHKTKSLNNRYKKQKNWNCRLKNLLFLRFYLGSGHTKFDGSQILCTIQVKWMTT